MILASLLISSTIFLPLVGVQPDMGTAAMTTNNCADLARVGARWSYQWHPQPMQCPGVQMIPMIWSLEFFSPTATPSPYLLGFNEPDQPSQADMTPDEGAVAWRKVEDAYPYRMLISPAPAYGPKWLREWRGEVGE